MTQSSDSAPPPLYAQLSSSWLGRQPSGSPTSPPATEESTGKHAVAEPDMVNHPPHYKCPNPKYDFQVIQIMEAWYLDRDHYLANAIKYLLRAPFKGRPVQDVGKARWYLDRWLQLREEEPSQLDMNA